MSAEEAKSIEQRIIDQADDEFWMNERRKRITASKVGTIAKMRVTTKFSATLQQLLYNKFGGNAATRCGQNNEDEARKLYVHYMREHTEIHVDHCGLFISPENPWLAASPDGLVTDPADESSHLGLVEIKKNPYSASEQAISEAATSTAFCLKQNKDGTYSLKPRHNYHFWVQCQLYCTGRDWCDFVVKTGKNVHIERIRRNDSWFKAHLCKLRRFYFNCVLPELACPRFRKGGISL